MADRPEVQVITNVHQSSPMVIDEVTKQKILKMAQAVRKEAELQQGMQNGRD
jgi:hypothetical protein